MDGATDELCTNCWKRTCGPQPDCELALQRRRCINATEGLLLSKPIPVSANAAFFCNRYKIVDGGTKVGQLHPPCGNVCCLARLRPSNIILNQQQCGSGPNHGLNDATA